MGLAEEMKRNLETARAELDLDVKIALIGQPGAGKSSLINKLVGSKGFEVGEHTDTTTDVSEANFGHLKIVDLPGYGTKQFPLDAWVERFHPEEYDLYLFVFEGKLHDADEELFHYLKEWEMSRSHPFFIVRNKEDQIWDEEKSLDEVKKGIKADVQGRMGNYTSKVYFVSCRQNTGIEELKRDIFDSKLETVKKDKLKAYFRATTKKDLEEKKTICLKKVDNYALLGAANAINPVLGVDIAIDLKIYFEMLGDIRKIYGIDDSLKEELKKYEIFAPMGQRVFDYATKEGVTFLIKKFSAQFSEKELAKYIPFVGQAVAACAGYGMMEIVGKEYVDDCFELANAILDGTLKRI